MKKFLALLIIFVLMLPTCFVVGAVEPEPIKIAGIDFTSGVHSELREDLQEVCVRPGNKVNYDVNLPTEVSRIKLEYRTGEDCQGAIEILLNGESVAKLDTTILCPTWATYTHVVNLPEPIIGNNTVTVHCHSGAHMVTRWTFLPIESSKKFAEFNLEDNFTDIANDANRHEINLLSDLGLIKEEGVMFKPERFMSRVDFVSLLGRLIEAETYAQKTSPFKDVDDENENAPLSSGLYQLGIIKGDTDGNFRPHDFITPLEAATVCANALGYTGYNNALDLAYSLKLFKGLSLQSNKITRSQGVKIIYNLLLADYLSVNEMGEDFVIYNPTKNFVEKSSKYAHGKGVMTANNVTELYSRKNSDQIEIDGIKYHLFDSSMSVDFLGVNCEFFYIEENGERYLHTIRPLPKAEVNVIKSNPNIKFDEISDKKLVYTYINEDEEIEYELDSHTAIIYNATAVKTNLISLIPDSSNFEGIITTIDNDGDGVLETIWIDHVTRVIKVEAIVGDKIKDKTTQDFYDTSEGEFNYFVENQSAGFDELLINDVISVYESSDIGKNKVTRAIKNLDTVIGTVKKTDGNLYTINDEVYKISNMCKDNIELGTAGTFIIDQFGNIIACGESEETDKKTGAFLAALEYEVSKLDFTAKIKMLTDKGVEIYDVAQRVIADGALIKTARDFYKGTDSFVGIENVAGRTPVIYRLNTNNEITMIDTVKDGLRNDDDQLVRLIEDGTNVAEGQGTYYRFQSNVFLNESYKALFGASSSLKFIAFEEKDEDCEILDKYTGVIDPGDAEILLYSTNRESKIADVVLDLDRSSVSSGGSTKPFLFKSVSLKVNSDGDVAHCINGISSSTEVSYEIDADAYGSLSTLIDSLKEGNIIDGTLKNSKLISLSLVYVPNETDIEQFGPATNTAGQPTILNVNTRKIEYNDDADAAMERRYYLSEIVDKEKTFIWINTKTSDIDEDDIRAFNVGSAKVAICEKTSSGKLVFTNDMRESSLVNGDIIVGVHTDGYALSSIYVFRDNSR